MNMRDNRVTGPDPEGMAGRPAVQYQDVAGLPPDDALAMRAVTFRAGHSDLDEFDRYFRHVVIRAADIPVLALRYRETNAATALSGYVARHYDLAQALSGFDRVLEVGRVCIDSGAGSVDGLRLLLGVLADIAVRERIDLLFGCSSLAGGDPATHLGTLEMLRATHLLPEHLRPRARVPVTLPAATGRCCRCRIPSLLTAYLSLGAGVGPDVVRDHDLDTLHVFAALDISRLPPDRASRLERLAHTLRANRRMVG